MDDSAILDLFFARSEAAIAALSQAYGAPCLRMAQNILGSAEDAEECVADGYLAAWNAIPPAKPGNLQAFLGKITRDISIDRLRRESRQKRGGTAVTLALSELEDCVTSGTTPEDELIRRQTVEAINGFLKTLPQEKRVAFVLRYWYLYSDRKSTRLNSSH